ncbi:MAG: intradiol ring-cleavage dioxygenase [Candidatus Poribacteria bacterium]|nr:intradiol ring-cleavage dioxygenase [Candidatus Poribacteria bacterium]
MKRREWFQKAAAAFGLTGVSARLRAAAESDPESDSEKSPDCVLTPSQTAGPFYFNPKQFRKDITEKREGVPLLLKLEIVRVSQCEPVPGAWVEIWHTDPRGVYSGYARQGDRGRIDARGEDFLRGIQVADKNGQVEFETLFPGWYRGRLTHIHFKVHLDERTVVTSQLYFPEKIVKEIYALEPYKARGQNPTDERRDGVLRRDDLKKLRVSAQKNDLKKNPKLPKNGYNASHIIGIA